MSLTISAVDTVALRVELKDPLATSRKTYDRLPYAFVRVTLSDGTRGIGETRESLQITGESIGTIVEMVRDVLAPAIIGRHPGDLQGLHDVMDRQAAANTAAKSAVDMAAHDAFARALGIPVHLLMGGGSTAPVATSKAIGVGDTSAMVAEARRAVQAGFATLKIKTGLDDHAEREAVRAIRAEVGPHIDLKLDANQAWTLQQAAAFLADVERCDIAMIEQPLPAWDYGGHAALRKRTAIPVMLDESVHRAEDAQRAIDAEACDYINIKLVKTGGLYPALALAAVAQSAGIACQVGSLDTTVGSAAAIHLARACPNAVLFAEINGPLRLKGDVATGYRYKQGRVAVDPAPGLGVVPDWEALGFAAAGGTAASPSAANARAREAIAP